MKRQIESFDCQICVQITHVNTFGIFKPAKSKLFS